MVYHGLAIVYYLPVKKYSKYFFQKNDMLIKYQETFILTQFVIGLFLMKNFMGAPSELRFRDVLQIWNFSQNINHLIWTLESYTNVWADVNSFHMMSSIVIMFNKVVYFEYNFWIREDFWITFSTKHRLKQRCSIDFPRFWI